MKVKITITRQQYTAIKALAIRLQTTPHTAALMLLSSEWASVAAVVIAGGEPRYTRADSTLWEDNPDLFTSKAGTAVLELYLTQQMVEFLPGIAEKSELDLHELVRRMITNQMADTITHYIQKRGILN